MRTFILSVLSAATLAAALPAAAQYSDNSYRDRPASQTDLGAADHRLNEVYQHRIVEAQASDRADRPRHLRAWYSREAALRDAERAWIAYRDADCRYAAQSDAGSRWAESSRRACVVDRTNERIAVLRDGGTRLSQR